MPGEVKISHNLDLGPEMPNEIMDIARKQGENPETVCADIQELREMIYGERHCVALKAPRAVDTSYVEWQWIN